MADCTNKTCTLSHTPISPSGPLDPLLMLIGEAPGQNEELMREFFVGKAGSELTNYLSMIQISRDQCYITNILHCRPPNDRDPKPAEIKACQHFLQEDLQLIKPYIIATLGRFATRWFLGDVDMEQVHGIPFAYDGWVQAIVVPIYHPAAGLHDSTNMSKIMSDFQALSQVLKGALAPRDIPPDDPTYSELTGEDVVVINEAISRSSTYTPIVQVDHELVARCFKPKKKLYLTDWIAQSGGINDPSLPGEIRDLVTGIGKGGRLKRAKGIPIGFLNRIHGRGLDIIVRDARETHFQVHDVDDLLLLMEKDIRCRLSGDDEGRVTQLTSIRSESQREVTKATGDAVINSYQEDKVDSSVYDELSDFFTAKGAELKSSAIDVSTLLRKVIAIDTETLEGGRPWCLTFCTEPGKAYMVAATRGIILEKINAHVSDPSVLTILHNSLFDLPVLAKMGIYPVNIVDTMIMAYLLQTEPQGLKALAYRYLGMKMRDYSEVITSATNNAAVLYLNAVLAIPWPDLEPVMEWVKGLPKVRKPQPLPKKVARLLNDYTKDRAVDLRGRWHNMDGRDMVEGKLGPMPEGYLPEIPRDEAKDYACRDADATLRLYPMLLDRIISNDLMGTLLRDMGVVPMISDMQDAGIQVDVPYFKNLTVEFQQRLDTLGGEIDFMVNDGLHTNPGSHIQALAVIKKLTGKQVKNTNRDTLEPLRADYLIIDKIVQWRGYDKLINTYLKVLATTAGEDSRIYTSFRITRVVTGRLSSHNPNLLAQPVRTEDGRRVRGGFVAKEGCSLLSLDYSQIELRVMAHMSEDPRMLDVFRTGKDIHTSTAAEIWGIPLDKVDGKTQRRPAKGVNFGIIYGISAVGLLKHIESEGVKGWTYHMCEDFIKEWFKLYPKAKSFMEAQKAHARRYGLVRDIFHRMRLIPEVKSSLYWIREEGLRKAINAPIQMGAQGIIKEAMGRLVPLYREFKQNGHIAPLLQIHDDLIWESSDELLPVVVPIIKNAMESAVELLVPVVVDGKVGKRWNEMEKWGEE